MVQCVWCRSHIADEEAVCRFCGTPQVKDAPFKVGDRIRIRNVFKGYHTETVTVVQVLRQGSALEVLDETGQAWACIHPRDVLGPAAAI